MCYFEADVSAGNTNARCFVLFGAADADASFFSGRSWLTMDESDTSSTFTCSSLLTSPDPDEYDEHNMCHVQVDVFKEAYSDEVDMGRIALSCHFLWMYCVTRQRCTLPPVPLPLVTRHLMRLRPSQCRQEHESTTAPERHMFAALTKIPGGRLTRVPKKEESQHCEDATVP